MHYLFVVIRGVCDSSCADAVLYTYHLSVYENSVQTGSYVAITSVLDIFSRRSLTFNFAKAFIKGFKKTYISLWHLVE